MKKILSLLTIVILFSSHDMYLKLDTYFLQPNTTATIKLFNGTFEKSENTIGRSRMIDVSLQGNGKRTHPDTTQWSERGNTTLLNFTTGASGTWVAGVSTRSRDFAMDAEAFNTYLAHDGITDMLKWRKDNNAIDQDAVERYSKHVKTIFQVGDVKTNDWQAELGYPIEFIPLQNPYDLVTGDKLEVKLLWSGKPLTNQIVTIDAEEASHSHAHAANHEHGEEADHDHGGEEDHHHHGDAQVRTDANGKLTLSLDKEGVWFLRTIYLVGSDVPGLTHESNWATLTFEVGHSHGEGTHTHGEGKEHSHAHDEEAGLPSYVFWGGSLVILAGLFFFFNQKS